MEEITDQYQRTFNKLRISLSSRCNLGCVYCVSPEEEEENRSKPASAQEQNELLDPGTMGRIVQALQEQLDIRQVRLTGGEPMLYPHLSGLIREIHGLGLTNIGMTSNASMLKNTAGKLAEAGLKSINVSLDAVHQETFKEVTRRKNMKQVLQGIDAGLAAGLEIKLNAVIMKGVNDEEILPLLEYAWSRGIVIRFLETMPMGHLHEEGNPYLFPEQDILDRIAGRYSFRLLEREESSTANYWETPEGKRFGIIANESSPFCADCNRLRLDSNGYIYGCLSNPAGIPVKDYVDQPEVLKEKLQEALGHKQPGAFTGSGMSMKAIGG